MDAIVHVSLRQACAKPCQPANEGPNAAVTHQARRTGERRRPGPAHLPTRQAAATAGRSGASRIGRLSTAASKASAMSAHHIQS